MKGRTNAVVIGGGGFLGRYIVRTLQENGRKVEVIGRRNYSWLVEQGIPCHAVDICNSNELIKALSGFDEVFHTAAKVGVWGKYKDFFETNVIGTQNVVDACKYNSVRRLIFTSSPSVIFNGQNQEGIDESHPYPKKFLNHYSQTKMLAEQIVLNANTDDELRTCVLRPHLIWGPEDTHLIPRILERGRSGKLVQIGDGSNKVDIVHVKNAAWAHLLAANELSTNGKCAGKSYFISQGEPVELWDFIKKILQFSGCSPIKHRISLRTAYYLGSILEIFYKLFRIKGEPRLTRFVALQLGQSHYYNTNAAKKDFDYESIVSTKEGLKQLFRYNTP